MANKITLTFAGDSKQLERTFDKVGDAAGKFDDKVKKSTDVLDGFGEAGVAAAGRFGASFAKDVPLALGKGVLAGPLGAAAAAAVPAVAAALSAGLLLAVGGGAIAAGIALIADDPKIGKAGQRLKDRFLDKDTSDYEKAVKDAEERVAAIKDNLRWASSNRSKARYREELAEAQAAAKKAREELNKATEFNRKNFSLRDAAKPFIEPVTRALDTFTERVAPKLTDSFGRMAKDLAPVIDKVAPALADMVEKALPGLEDAAKASVPLFETLAEHAPEIGEAVSKFFTKLGENAPAAEKFLDNLLSFLEWAIPAVADALVLIIKFYAKATDFWRGVFNKIGDAWDWISEKASAASSWITEKWGKVTAWFKDLPGKLKDALSKVKDAISGPFRSAFNAIARAWNNTVGRLSWTVPGWVPIVGGNSVSAPKLPTFHKGGVVPGAPGQEVVALLQAGERVTPAGQSAPPAVIEFRSGGSQLDDLLVEILSRAVRRRGGNVQLVLGGSRG